MAKRLVRYDSQQLNPSNISKLLGKKVNIVCTNGHVLFANLEKQEDDTLLISNMRQRKTKIALKDIAEIIVDYTE